VETSYPCVTPIGQGLDLLVSKSNFIIASLTQYSNQLEQM